MLAGPGSCSTRPREDPCHISCAGRLVIGRCAALSQSITGHLFCAAVGHLAQSILAQSILAQSITMGAKKLEQGPRHPLLQPKENDPILRELQD